MQETQYWGIVLYGLRCDRKHLFIALSYCREKQHFVIPFIADIRNLFYLPYLTFFYIDLCILFYIFYFWKQPLKIIP